MSGQIGNAYMRFDRCYSPSNYWLLETYGDLGQNWGLLPYLCESIMDAMYSMLISSICTIWLHSTFCKTLAPSLYQKLGELVLTAATLGELRLELNYAIMGEAYI